MLTPKLVEVEVWPRAFLGHLTELRENCQLVNSFQIFSALLVLNCHCGSQGRFFRLMVKLQVLQFFSVSQTKILNQSGTFSQYPYTARYFDIRTLVYSE